MTNKNVSQAPSEAERLAWKEIVAKYQKPSTPLAVWQLVNTLGPYVLLWIGMYVTMSISWWLAIPLAVLSGAFLVRIFIIFHDCGHGSFFKSKRANDWVGMLTGLLTFTSYYQWKWEHSVHHASAGDLDKRGIGDIWTMTVQEYLESSRWRRFSYRLARNPVILFLIAPLFLFLVRERFPNPSANARDRRSVYWMNLAILVMVVSMSWVFGLKSYLVLQLVSMGVAGAAGVWMFYVQHQFEDVYWERGEDWDFVEAALQGSSYYKLPRVLQWFSGNIGFHHIHHLSSRIPNYNLERCHRSHALFREVKAITLFSSLKTLKLRLWDEKQRKLVGYRALRGLPRGRKQPVAA
jgi:omega-6 fatty acid desaturase (delta-12 desaturase)